MSVVEIPDDGGDVVTAVEFNGDIFPNFDPEIIKNLSSASIKDGDICMCAYPKSGTHWMWEVTRLILSGDLEAEPVADKTVFMFERTSETKYKDYHAPRLLNTHLRVKHIPSGLFEKKVKIIYLLRNPKDVAVSWYNFNKKVKVPYKGLWENFLKPYAHGKFQYGSWFDYVKEWEDVKRSKPHMDIITLHYEDVKESPIEEMRKLAGFLGVERSDAFLDKVRQQCSFDNMKSRAVNTMAYRKGEVGDWKNWFTVSQNEWFDKQYKDKMAGYDLNFKYVL